MFRFYVAVAVCTAFFCCFWVGTIVGRVRCNLAVTQAASENIIENVKQLRIYDEKVIRTSVGDIRRILHEKYTIAE